MEDIIALYNPVAIDLRFVLAMLKINTNLERLGDFAEGIARFVIRCKEPVLDAELMTRLRLGEMHAEVLSMLELAKRALHEESIEMATTVFGKDTNKPAGKKIRAKKNGAFHKAPFFSFQ